MAGWLDWLGGGGVALPAAAAVAADAVTGGSGMQAAGRAVGEVAKVAAHEYQKAEIIRQEAKDEPVLKDLKERDFTKYQRAGVDAQRDFVRKADEAIDRLGQKGRDDAVIAKEVRKDLRFFVEGYVDQGAIASRIPDQGWSDPRFDRHCSPGDGNAVVRGAKDVRQMADHLRHCELVGPGSARKEVRAKEEKDFRAKYGIRDESPKRRPEAVKPVAIPSDPAPQYAASPHQPSRAYDDRPRTNSPNPRNRYQDFPLPGDRPASPSGCTIA